MLVDVAVRSTGLVDDGALVENTKASPAGHIRVSRAMNAQRHTAGEESHGFLGLGKASPCVGAMAGECTPPML